MYDDGSWRRRAANTISTTIGLEDSTWLVGIFGDSEWEQEERQQSEGRMVGSEILEGK